LNTSKKNGKRIVTVTGTLQGTGKGFAFILPDGDYDNDFFVPKKYLNGAYHGDKVIAERILGTRDEARILKITERANPRVVGTLQKEGNLYFVYPDNVRQPQVFINDKDRLCARSGEKVVCLITSYPKGKAPGGKVVEVLGKEGDFEA
ncbi:MAG: ribonuclease R, partial [Clostridia bacterium]|nr:ribonuclease R [Clostridia bacterium]